MAVSLAIDGTEDNHLLYRDDAVNHMENDPESFAWVPNDSAMTRDEQFANFLDEQRQPKTYVTSLQLPFSTSAACSIAAMILQGSEWLLLLAMRQCADKMNDSLFLRRARSRCSDDS